MKTADESQIARSVPLARSHAPSKPAVMLVLATVGGGMSFPLGKDWMEAAQAHAFAGGAPLATLTLISLRMIAAIVLVAVLFPRLVRDVSRKQFLFGLAVGALVSAGTILQIWGLDDTTPALSAFFTSLASPLVPLLCYAIFRTEVARLTLVGLAVGMAGVLVLSMRESGQMKLHQGDMLTLGSTLVFAAVIIALSRWGGDAPPGHLLVGMLAGTGLPALVLACMLGCTMPAGPGAWLQSTAAMLWEPAVLIVLALLILLPTVLGTYWMSTYQPLVPASRAALIYLLEPVFAALASLAWGHDRISLHLIVGGITIVGGNLLAELPGMMKASRKRRAAAIEGQCSPSEVA